MALQNIEANITLDLYNHDTTPTTIKAIQLDSETRYVAARLQNMGTQYDMDSGATVQLTVIRPDKVGVQISGTTFTYGDEGAQFLGPYAELTLVALAVSGKLLGQFKITSGTQILRTEIFTISAGVALDASTDEWAGQYDGYNLDELVEKVDTAVSKVDGMEADVSDLKSDFTQLTTATAEDVGKALKAKTVTDGKVTEWEFGEAGVAVDPTLEIEGKAADAKATGEAVSLVRQTANHALENSSYDETETGDYFVFDSSDNIAKINADSTVIVGSKNMIAVDNTDEVGRTYTNNGISRIRNADDSYTIYGTATRNNPIAITQPNIAYLPGGEYTLSGCPARTGDQAFSLAMDYWAGTSRKSFLRDNGEGKTGTLPLDYTKAVVWFNVPDGTVIDTPITIRPQLERGATKTEYVKCVNREASSDTDISVSEKTFVFARNEFTLSVYKAIGGIVRKLDSDVTKLSKNVEDVTAESKETKNSVLKPYPLIHCETAKIVSFMDGGDQLPVSAFAINVPYSASSIDKIRAFVSSQNMFSIADVVTKKFVTKNEDDSLVASGSTVSIYSGTRSTFEALPENMERLPYLLAGTYNLSSNPAKSLGIRLVDRTTESTTNIVVSDNGQFNLNNDSLIDIYIKSNGVTVSDIIISKDSATEYENDLGQTYIVPFVDTDGESFVLYGGIVDPINGVVTELYDSSGNELENQIVHRIAPVTIKTCLGFNHIWSEGNSVDVTYRANIKDYVDQRNLSEQLQKYNIDVTKFGNIRFDSFMSPNANVIGVAHRGLSQTHPENTMPAFKAAAQAGFLAVETDIEWTSDGVPVLLHDSTINRTARNADGSEISTTISIRDITYAQALEYDFGIWKGSEFAGTKIPTLAEFMLFCKKAGLHPQIELKYNAQTMEQTLTIMRTVMDHGMIDRVWWTSNFKDLLLQILSVHQGACIVLIMTAYNETRWNDMLEIRAKYPAANIMLACGVDYMSAEEMAQVTSDLRDLGIPMGIWTINSTVAMQKLDPYITAVTSNILNAPDVMRESVLS